MLRKNRAIVNVLKSTPICKILARLSPSIITTGATESINIGHSSKLSFSTDKAHFSQYITEQRGCLYDKSYRLYLKNANDYVISPFHDVPLHAENNIYNMVVEIPRWSNAKMEICTDEKMNPIKQDVKKGQLVFVANCFPHNGYLWNYGALPQTWEDPSYVDSSTGTKGDGDPIDVCEIGSKIHSTGSIIKVKLLGILALIDEGETDWKIICIDISDPLSTQLNTIEDIEKTMPGLLKSTVRWFKMYKTPFGSPPNRFAFDEKIMDHVFANNIVKEVHKQWKKLVLEKSDTSVQIERASHIFESPYKVSVIEASETLQLHPAKGNPKIYGAAVNKWHYIM